MSTTEPTVPTTDGSVLDPAAEFDRQVANLIDLGYPALSGRTATEYADLLAPLRATALARATGSGPLPAPTRERVPFVLVLPRELAAPEHTMPMTRRGNRPGFADYDADDLAGFGPIADLDVPAGPYLAYDVERLGDTLGQTPDEAAVGIAARRRTPITIEEGIALITQFPDTLEKNHCFHTAGSRRGDQRVPALWISKNAPKLGWCWARNRHTWLGVASCAARVE